MKSMFRPKEVTKLLDVSYRQIQYWDKTNLISPSERRNGKYRHYTFGDVLQLRIAAVLKKHGYSTQALRALLAKVQAAMKKINFPLREAVFMFRGERVLIFQNEVVGDIHDFVAVKASALREDIHDMFEGGKPERHLRSLKIA